MLIIIISRAKNLERSVAGKFMTGIMWRFFENPDIFFPVIIFPFINKPVVIFPSKVIQ